MLRVEWSVLHDRRVSRLKQTYASPADSFLSFAVDSCKRVFGREIEIPMSVAEFRVLLSAFGPK